MQSRQSLLLFIISVMACIYTSSSTVFFSRSSLAMQLCLCGSVANYIPSFHVSCFRFTTAHLHTIYERRSVYYTQTYDVHFNMATIGLLFYSNPSILIRVFNDNPFKYWFIWCER